MVELLFYPSLWVYYTSVEESKYSIYTMIIYCYLHILQISVLCQLNTL